MKESLTAKLDSRNSGQLPIQIKRFDFAYYPPLIETDDNLIYQAVSQEPIYFPLAAFVLLQHLRWQADGIRRRLFQTFRLACGVGISQLGYTRGRFQSFVSIRWQA